MVTWFSRMDSDGDELNSFMNRSGNAIGYKNFLEAVDALGIQ